MVLLDDCYREISSLYLLITRAISVLCWNEIIRFGVFIFQIMLLISIATRPVLRCVNWEESGVCVIICDRIWESPACRENAQAAQCALLVPQVENCRSPVFVIFM